MFTPKRIILSEINGGARYVDENEVSPEAINRPIEASAYAQEKAERALELITDAVGEKVTLSAYPVGSVYISTRDESPAVLLGGGTWEAITGRFLIGSGTVSTNTTGKYGALNGVSETFILGERGGQFRHTLTVDEMPKHSHTIDRPKWYYSDSTTTDNIIGATTASSLKVVDTTTTTIKNTGGNGMHNIVNPYYVVNIWKRIA